jgi:hypothetical protein
MSDEIAIGMAVTVAALLILAGHWFPWRKLWRSGLHPLGAYVFGVICILTVPVIVMYLRGATFYAQLLLAAACAAGVATASAYGIDAIIELRHRYADEKERADAASRRSD